MLFAVYAPFGTDPVLSRYPGDQRRSIRQQPLVKALMEVARQGVNVAALVDLHDDDSWLVEIPAHRPGEASFASAWKQAMDRPQALAGFLRRAHHRFPCDALVLALEGHGAGYLPDIDGVRVTPDSTTDGNTVDWRIDGEGASPSLPPFSGSPELPVDSPEAVPVTLPLATWSLGEALRSARRAGVPRPAVIHFNNCFNMSVELLHTVAPHAAFATGYGNYNFFTAGAAYPKVFERLRLAGSTTAEQLARWFAAENAAGLRAKGNHPTVGATVRLSRMKSVTTSLNALAGRLTQALRTNRAANLGPIKAAIVAAAHYDTDGDFALATPDQTTDLGSLAARLQTAFPAGPIHAAAASLQTALAGIWQYGDFERPWLDETQIWDFRDPRLGMSILLPDPALEGRWDWRSPYYLSGTIDATRPPAQRHQIDFLRDTPKRPPWVEFLVEYHRDVPFVGLLRAKAPVFPIFNARFKPNPDYPPPSDDGSTGKSGVNPKKGR